MSKYPFSVVMQREAIDEHKANSLANPWKLEAYNRIGKAACIAAWIEQIGDAELYEQKWNALQED